MVGNFIQGVYVSALRNYEGTWTTVAQGKSDATGLATLPLIGGETYRIMINYNGQLTNYGQITATATTIKVTLNETLELNFTSGWNGISYRILPYGNIEIGENETNHTETFRFAIADYENKKGLAQPDRDRAQWGRKQHFDSPR